MSKDEPRPARASDSNAVDSNEGDSKAGDSKWDPRAIPSTLGYRMPAEWELHAATWIAWPHERSDWPGKFAPIAWVYTEIAKYLARSERVCLLVRGRKRRKGIAETLNKAGVDLARVDFVEAATDRSWLRDSLPTCVVSDRPGVPRVALVHWRFNGWARYDNHARDCKLPKLLSKALGSPRFAPRRPDGTRVVVEGGAIEVNGRGTLLTTEECLLSGVQERNPGLDREAYERLFADYLGVNRVVWLGRGIAGDDTHGHVDDLSRFVDERTVVTVVETQRDDPNFEPLRENCERLERATDQDGAALRVVPLPMPKPVYFSGQRLPASYANFYVANTFVLVPTFNDPHDRVALDTLTELFPGRTVVGIHAVDLVLGLGTLHCLTQQQPAGQMTSATDMM